MSATPKSIQDYEDELATANARIAMLEEDRRVLADFFNGSLPSAAQFAPTTEEGR